ncbi:MAG: M12 family metallopeptidase [Mucilaginibacter sp.]
MKKQLILIVALLCLFSCKQQSIAPSSQAAKPSLDNRVKPEELFPGEHGQVQTGTYYGQQLTYQVIHGLKVFQGDIVLPDNAVQSSLIISSTGRPQLSPLLWTGATVYYTIDPALYSVNGGANAPKATDAIAYWNSISSSTTVHLSPRTTQTNYVTFRYSMSGSASSGVGMVGGQQFIDVADVSTAGNIIHEIGHTVGLWHEHCRADRNSYVTINYANIGSGAEINFETYVQAGQSGYDYTGGLDFGSIMMYDSYSFTSNGLPTIVKTNGTTFTAQRTALSTTDMAGVKYMYTIPPPPQNITFKVNSTNSQTTGYSMSDGSINIASGRTVSQTLPNTISTSGLPVTTNATITMTVINGYMPVNAFINTGSGAISGVISGHTITFNGVNIVAGSETATITLQ